MQSKGATPLKLWPALLATLPSTGLLRSLSGCEMRQLLLRLAKCSSRQRERFSRIVS